VPLDPDSSDGDAAIEETIGLERPVVGSTQL
jgi:hypothetical protein